MEKELKRILVIFFIYKLFILSFGTSVYYLVPESISHKNIELDNPLVRPWHQFDTRAYLDIAKNGYRYEYGVTTTNFGWYPFYPFLIRLFGIIGYDAAAYLIPQIFSFLAIASLYILLREDMNKNQARKTIFYILLFPTAYFLTALYTESIFLFFSAMTFYFARKDKWIHSGIMGYFAVLTRFIGMAMLIPILYMYIRNRGFKINANLMSIFLIPAAFLTLMIYHYLTFGNPLLQFYTQSQFSRGIGLPHTAFVNTISEIMSTKSIFVVFYNYFNILMTVFFLLILFTHWRKMRPEYWIYVLLSFLMVFSSGILSSVTRFELVMFPIFMVISGISEKSKMAKISLSMLFIIFFAIQLLALANHVNGEIDFSKIF